MFNIAIDGPSGAGKSSVSNIIASKLNLTHLDTGAMYRCVAYYVINNNVALDDETNISKLLETLNLECDHNIFSINGKVVGDEIRTNQISLGASDVSKLGCVRTWLVAKQQEIAKDGGYILDGRDIGTVVLKDAKYKFFLTASPEVRADRRVKEYKEKNIECNYDDILQDIIKRDYQDSHRAISPLKQADDAILIDSSNLNREEVVDLILSYIK